MRGKYAPLHRHLSNLDAREWSTTFREVERILDFHLPASARTYREWWANHGGNPQGKAWVDVRWKVEHVNLRTERVVFRRTRSSAHRSNTPVSRPNRAIAPSSSTNTKAPSALAGQPSAISAKAGTQMASKVRQPTTTASRKITDKSRLPLDIHNLMQGLSYSRQIFHSEADFQHAFAWKIHEIMPDSQIRLEYPFRRDGNPMYLDIWLPTERMAIELKYLTRRLEQDCQAERFALKDQSAHDVRRYDFLKDVQRLESVVEHDEQPARCGVAVLLTNDSAYSKSPTSRWEANNDAAFRLHEGRAVTGNLRWSEYTGKGTMSGREDPIRLQGSYTTHWRDYSRLGEGNNQRFRYLAVAVQ